MCKRTKMRKIQFRGKSGGKWVKGSLIITVLDGEQKSTYWIKPQLHAKDNNLNGKLCKINPETVGQFTGCFDCYDKPIFEGDIVEYEDSDRDYYYPSTIPNVGVVEYSEFGFNITDRQEIELAELILGSNVIDCEVIGNIYDNPELIEGFANE